MARARVDWVTMGPEPHFSTCQRCGGTDPKPAFPLSVAAFSAYAQYVTERHRGCLPLPSV